MNRRGSSPIMRILISTGLNAGEAEYKNLGDVAMLQAAVKRLRALWPQASLEVVTDSPGDLARFCPDATAVSRTACLRLVGKNATLGRLHASLPRVLSETLGTIQNSAALLFPRVMEAIVGKRLGPRDACSRRDFITFVDALNGANLLVVCGSGGFADSCRDWNLNTLATIAAAVRRQVPAVMLGQGIGPLSDKECLARASRVLPKLKVIALRGTAGGVQLLDTLGVRSNRVMTTGDDTVELAYDSRSEQLGNALGVNLRMAFYAGVNVSSMRSIKAAIQTFARDHGISLLPVPIAFHQAANDRASIHELLSDGTNTADDGSSLDTPESVIRQVSRCRVLVTGAYHAAVFALAQGIPAVCLSGSAYYRHKFEGLRELFGRGCEILDVHGQISSSEIGKTIENCWHSAEMTRAELLQAALRQIDQGRAVYEHVKAILELSPRKDSRVTESFRMNITAG